MASRRRKLDRKTASLADPSVRGWYSANATGAQLTADVTVRGLSRLLESIGLTPVETVALATQEPKRLEAVLVGYVGTERKRGVADSYLRKTFAALKSFLRHEGAQFDLYPKLKVIEGVSIRDESVPSPELLGRILARLPLRWQAAALLMAHSGLRPGVLALHSGVARPTARTAAVLQIRHLPELSTETAVPTFAKVPFQIRVPEELSKSGSAYVTFGTPEAAKILSRYFQERRESGEQLTDESPVIAGKLSGTERRTLGEAVTTETLTFAIRGAMRHVAPEQRMRPYVLRAYASTMLLLAEQRTAGRITRDAREALLGHDLGVSGRYNLSKRLSPDLVENLREQYSAAVPYLETSGQRQDNLAELNRRLLEWFGGSPEEVKRLGSATDDEFSAFIRKKLSEAGSDSTANRVQRIVSITDAQAFLDKGWKTVVAVRESLVLDPPE